MGHYLLRYTVAADYLERRVALRAVHLAHANAAVARGELLLGGAIETTPVRAEPVEAPSFSSSADEMKGGPSTGSGRTEVVEAMLLFSADTPDVAERFAKADPYVTNGLVTAWRVDRWLTVVGEQAAETIQP